MQKNGSVRKWQLVGWRERSRLADFTNSDFIAVGKRAVARHGSVEEVWFPPTLSAVKTNAFRHCRRLKRIVLPGTNSVGLSTGAFEGCGRLQAVEHSELLTVIGKDAFLNCRMLREMRFGRDLRRIGEGAFRGCRSLTQISIPPSVETLGSSAFAGCWELEHLELEEGLPQLSANMFRECISLRELAVPESVRVLPCGVFRDCTALTELRLPGTVRRLGSSAFRGCRSLTAVVLGLGTCEIGAFAFSGNSELRRVEVPHSLKRLGFGAFGLGYAKQKIVLSVDSEYMCKRLRRLLILCGSAGRAVVRLEGKTLEERKRERHRQSLDQKGAHIS